MVDADHVSLTSGCGGVEPSAYVTVINTSLPGGEEPVGVVAVASPCGAWSATVFAQVHDQLEITQQVGLNFGTTRITVGQP